MTSQQVMEILVRGRNESHKLFNEMSKDVKLSREDAVAFAAGWEKAAAQHEKAMQRIAAEQKRSWEKTKSEVETSAKAVLQAAALAVGAIASITVAIVALGKRGSEIINVERALASLAGGARTAQQIIDQGRAASKGLISDFDLASAATKGLTLGLPITAQSMGVLTQSSVALGQAMRREPVKAMEDLILGLSRGSARILDNIGIVVRSEDAYGRWAAAHGRNVDALTQGEKAMAIYEAAIVAASAKFEQLGGVQVTFGERLTQVKVGIQNFTDSLGKAIALSAVMNRAAELAGVSLQKAFGKDQTKSVELLVQHVNQFAIFLVQAGKVATYVAEVINAAWTYIAISIRGAMVAALLPFEPLMKNVAVLLEVAAKVNPVFASMAVTARSVSDQISLSFLSLTKDLSDSFLSGRQRLDGIEKLREGLAYVEDELQKVAATNKKVEQGHRDVARAATAAAEAMSPKERAQEQKAYLEFLQRTVAIYKEHERWLKKLTDQAEEYGKKLLKQIKEAQKEQEELTERNARIWAQARERIASDMAGLFSELSSTVGGVFGALLRQMGQMLSAWIASNKAGLGDFFMSARGQAVMGYAQAAMAAFTMGNATGQRIGSPGRGALGGAATGAATGALVGSILPGIGTAGGAIVGGALGAFGGYLGGRKAQAENRKAMEEMRQALLQQFGSMAALQKKADELGVSIAGAFSTKNAQHFQQIVDNLNAAMEAQRNRIEGIQTALSGLGKLTAGFNAELERSNTEITDSQRAAFQRLGDYAAATLGLMLRETGNLIAALRAMGDTIEQLIDTQTRFGLEGSAAFQQLIGLYNVLKDNEDLAQQIEGLTLLMQGLGQAGIQSGAIFQAFGLDITRIFEEMTGRGVDATTAMILMQPSLQALWEHQQRFGDITDEATLALLREAETNGIVGENMRSVNDRILQVLLAIAEVLGADIPNALRNLPTDTTIRVNVELNDPNDILGGGPIPPDNSDPNNPIPGSQGFAWGGRVPWTPGGRLVRAGERVSENVLSDDQLAGAAARLMQITGGSRPGAASVGGGQAQPVIVQLDGRTLLSFVIPAVAEASGDGRLRTSRRSTVTRIS